jgi:glucose uptake protein GlcU
LLAAGFSMGSLVLYGLQILLGNNEGLFDKTLLFAALAGVFWATAIMALVKSIDSIGLARSNQWKNLQGPVGVLLSLVVLHEAQSVNPWLAMLSGLIIFSAAIALNIQPAKRVPRVNLRGVSLALLAGIMFGTVSMISKYVTDNAGVYSQNVWLSLSILFSLLAYQLITTKRINLNMIKSRREVFLGLASGLLYVGASTFMFLSFQRIEASIAFTIIQMNFILVVGLGIFVFKEIEVKNNGYRIALGLILATLGVVVLAFAR